MKIVCVTRRMNGPQVLERKTDKGAPLPFLMQELSFSWIPRCVPLIAEWQPQIRHPENKEWVAVFQLDYQPGLLPNGTLLIRPRVHNRLMPGFRLAERRPPEIEILEERLMSFLYRIAYSK